MGQQRAQFSFWQPAITTGLQPGGPGRSGAPVERLKPFCASPVTSANGIADTRCDKLSCARLAEAHPGLLQPLGGKSEARNPKSEGNPKSEIRSAATGSVFGLLNPGDQQPLRLPTRQPNRASPAD
jgi:hypothetical protein